MIIGGLVENFYSNTVIPILEGMVAMPPTNLFDLKFSEPSVKN